MADLMEVYAERYKPEKAVGLNAVIQLNISGEGGGDYTLRIDNGTFASEEGSVDKADITVTSNFSDWLKINKGEANALAMMMTGKVKIRGSVPMAMKFQSIFF